MKKKSMVSLVQFPERCRAIFLREGRAERAPRSPGAGASA